MERVTHDGRATAYRQVGADDEGPTTLYVHGSGATHDVWTAQYAPQAPAHPAVALDLAGHGESPDVDADPGAETLATYAEDVIAVARATGADVLVGNSMGGAVALHVALDGEFEPSALVLAGTGAKLAVAEQLRTLLSSDFEAAIAALHAENMLFHDPAPELVERSREAMRAVGQAVTRRDFLTCHAFDVRDRLDEIAAPTLAIVGEYDRLTPVSFHEYLAEEIPDGRLRVVDEAAHLAMAERPSAFNDAVASFLASLDD